MTHNTLHKSPSVQMVRRPAVAGYFYPADPAALRERVDRLTQTSEMRHPAHAVIVPHGSYRHAGAIAGAVYGQVTIPRRCILLGPSHTGTWMPWSLMMAGAYRTPLGDVPIDEACAHALQVRCPFLEADAWSQRGEHAIEVQLPFLQRLGPPDLTVVPIVTSSNDPAVLAQLATALAQVMRMQEEPVLLIATSDFSHYERQAVVVERDRALLDTITQLDRVAFSRQVQADGVVMCGDSVVACVLEAARQLGAHKARVIRYGTSADAGGDPDSAIGYAGVIIT